MEIDNNGVENAIRPTAVGKKNWLFVDHAEAGQRGAVIYSLIENCRRRGIELYSYLRDVLTRLPTMTNWTVGQLTPVAWAKSHGCRGPRPRWVARRGCAAPAGSCLVPQGFAWRRRWCARPPRPSGPLRTR